MVLTLSYTFFLGRADGDRPLESRQLSFTLPHDFEPSHLVSSNRPYVIGREASMGEARCQRTMPHGILICATLTRLPILQ
jgi:hypothetical protein